MGAILMGEGPNGQKPQGRRTENKHNRKLIINRNQLLFNYKNE